MFKVNIATLLLAALSSVSLAGEHPEALSSSGESKQENTTYEKLYGFLYAGTFSGTENNDQLETHNYKGSSRIPWGIGLGYLYSKHLSVDVGFEYWGERYKRTGTTTISGTANNFLQIDNKGLALTAKYHRQFHKLHGYGGIGTGVFSSQLWITDPSSGLLTTDGAPDDYLVGYHLLIGGGYPVFTDSYLGIEIRHRIAKIDFGEYTNGEVDVGGTSILLTWYTN